jgi:parvulin-like peptidyl-prolyl isomerase
VRDYTGRLLLMNKLRLVLVPAILALLLVVLAGCGGGKSAELGATDVAVVGDTQISKQQFDNLISTAKASFKQQGREFPKQGTPEYATIKSQAVTLLVQQAEREEKAKELGVDVTDKQISDRLAQIKKQYFQGKESVYKQQLKQQGLTDDQVKNDIKSQQISEQIYNKVTKDVKVSDADVHKYYLEHPSLYKQAESRQVRHILVKQKSLADTIVRQLKGGGDFAALAKKYSTDTGTAAQGGKYLAVKGQSVAPFDKAAFSLKTNEVSQPVKTVYGWHVIEPIGAVQAAKTTPEKQVADQIRQQLLQTKKQEKVNGWSKSVQDDFCGDSQIKYQAGFKPSPDPCAATTTSSTTTG